jgi:hypothetical protein
MKKKIISILIVSLFFICSYGQKSQSKFSGGFYYGFGSEIKNANYTHTNSFYKAQFYYTLKNAKCFTYHLVVQPELNFATHQLINLYFVKPNEPNYLERREEFTKLKDIREYILNIGFVVRKPITKVFSVYILGSVGPMITDTETERLSKGFAFSDVLAVGLSTKVGAMTFDIRPSLRHVSNAGLNESNSGFNTKNIEFGVSFPL